MKVSLSASTTIWSLISSQGADEHDGVDEIRGSEVVSTTIGVVGSTTTVVVWATTGVVTTALGVVVQVQTHSIIKEFIA